MRHLLISLSFLLLTCPSAVYSVQNRVALVIGNGSYRNAPLRNPVNDARLMRNLLRKAGFSVTIVENARKNELVNAIRRFGKALRNSDAQGSGSDVLGSPIRAVAHLLKVINIRRPHFCSQGSWLLRAH